MKHRSTSMLIVCILPYLSLYPKAKAKKKVACQEQAPSTVPVNPKHSPKKGTAKQKPEQSASQQHDLGKKNLINSSETPRKEADTTKSPQQIPAPRSLQVANDISDKMLGYTYLFVTYHPTIFTIKVNGVLVDQANKKKITLHNDTLEITYYCEFQNGRKSSRKYIYTVKPGTTSLNFTFNWHKDPRIRVDSKQATLTNVEVINV